MNKARLKLRQFVVELLEEQGVDAPFGDDEPLISSGIIDSLSVIQVILFMEREFGMDFGTLFFDQTNFDSVDEMLRFIEEHSQAGGKETGDGSS